MGLLTLLFRRSKREPAVTILIGLCRGPLDGAFEEITRDDLQATSEGVIWRARWRPNVHAVYVFETPPELAWHGGKTRLCWMGRFLRWE